MNAGSVTGRRIGWGITGVMTIAAVAAIVAPPAFADVTQLDVSSGGGTLVVGSTYQLRAKAENFDSQPVMFRDNGSCIGSRPTTSQNTGALVIIDWTPTSAGTHTITATQAGVAKSVRVEVIAAAGQPAAPAATPSGCGGGGSIGSGSAGS
ncbi:hypothetical protein [Nocardia sp. NBC_01327]|uniref:hypothetical protein n=1 Tax=Nocardia sp. NBC_01327 TaxID=2903593 RepID=UPI002E0ED080|nr:hypothetical protein OG326_14450 [Nocardia sp. NBC_01327]